MPTKKQTTTATETAPEIKKKAPAKPKANAADATKPVAEKSDAPTAKETTAPKKKAAAPKAEASQADAPKAASKAAAPKTDAPAAKKATAPQSLTKAYGEIQVSGDTYFLHKGSVSEGQWKLDAKKGDLTNQLSSLNGQFVTILGELSKQKKTDKEPVFVLRSIASHDQIARRAYDLSHQNPNSVEDNWLTAENELLQQ